MTDAIDLACTDGQVLLDCDGLTDGPLFGQDGHYESLQASFRPDVGVIHDEVSGLSWEARATGRISPVDVAEAYCDELVLGGFDDWRMPEIEALITLIDLGDPQGIPTQDLITFANASLVSRTRSGDGQFYWALKLGNHVAPSELSSGSKAMHCVRGPQPPSLFERQGEVVHDRVTGLTWQQGFHEAEARWPQSLVLCENLSLGGFDDWRLPSYKELLSLVSWQRVPAIDTDLFALPAEPVAHFWSSSMVTPDCVDDLEACDWFQTMRAVDFISGVSGGGFGASFRSWVRCVR